MKENKLDVEDIDLVILAALRYAMGRSSYIVSTIQNFVLKHWNNPCLVPRQHIILKDLDRFIQESEELNNIDPEDDIHQSWIRLRNRLEQL